MKTFKTFLQSIDEETIAFTYDDGGDEQTVLITGSSKQINKIKKTLPAKTKLVDNVPKGALKMSASDWLNLQ